MVEIDKETVEALRRSKTSFRAFYPVLKAPDGTIVDGNHRLEADPNWFSVVLKDAVTPEKIACARLIINTTRRTVKPEEIIEGLIVLAKAGWTVEEMARGLGKSETWVYKYLPDEYKNKIKAEAGAVGGIVKAEKFSATHREAKPQDLRKPTLMEPSRPQLVECEYCHTYSSSTKDWHGHQLCDKCFSKAEQSPEHYETFFSHTKSQPLPKHPVKEYKPKETWEHRKAVMSPPVSKMEMLVLEKLSAKGFTPETQKQVCIRYCRPDYWFELPQGSTAVFLDGEPHVGREDRDESLREELAKREVHVLSLSYTGSNEKDAEDIAQQILEALNG